MYKPLATKATPQIKRFTGVTPFKGENLRQHESLLDASYAIQIVNYLPDAEGKMRTRGGLQVVIDIGAVGEISFYKRFINDNFIYAYGTTVAAYNQVTGTTTIIKNNFSANTGFDGVRYGDYFFVCNGVDKIWRIDSALAIAEVAASPVCSTLVPFGARLIAGNLLNDESAVQYSETDTGANPPFTAWSNGTTATQGGIVRYANAGAVKRVVSLGRNVVVFAENGKWSFYLDQIDSSGTIKKIEQIVTDRVGLGGFDAEVTDKGVFYVNGAGVWNLVSLGQPNIPFSDQESTVSFVLGKEYFDNLNFDGSSIAYDNNNKYVLISCKQGGSDVNNFVIVYNALTGAMSRIPNWNIQSFFVDNNNDIYATSSTTGKVYKCFKGYDDEGMPIGTQYYQELNVSDFNLAKTLQWFAIQADLSPDSTLRICFDIIDLYSTFIENKVCYQMTAQSSTAETLGYGIDPYGSSYGSAGSDNPSNLNMTLSQASTLPYYDSFKPMLRNFQRVRVNVTSSDFVPHTLNMFYADVKQKSRIRRRKIVQV